MNSREINLLQKYLKRELHPKEKEIKEFVVLMESLPNEKQNIKWLDLALGIKDIGKTLDIINKAIKWENAWKIKDDYVYKI
jgi:uncharacterized iron-regulated protein